MPNSEDLITPSGLKLIREFKSLCLSRSAEHGIEAADRILQLPGIVFDTAIALSRLSLLAPQQQLEASVIGLAVQFGHLQLRRIELAYRLTDEFLLARRRWLFKRMLKSCRGRSLSAHQARSFSIFRRPDMKQLYCRDPCRLATKSQSLNKVEIIEFWSDLAMVEDCVYDSVNCVLTPPPNRRIDDRNP